MPKTKPVTQKISIDPITRLEGHGRIDLFLNEQGGLDNAYMIIPELRGFEKFCEGRPVEEMPRITQRICGVCPIAHHIAAAKAGDAVYHVEPPPAGKMLRELLYMAFFVADHSTHFYVLGGPDFVVGPDAPKGRTQYSGRGAQGRARGGRAGDETDRREPRDLQDRRRALYPSGGRAGGRHEQTHHRR